MTTNDIDAIRQKWASQCGPCDVGLYTMRCACPEGDYRPVVAALCDEVEHLRAELAEYAADNQRVAAALVKTDAQLTAAQQNIRDRYEHIAKLELHIADLETQCNEQMHQLAERASTQEATR